MSGISIEQLEQRIHNGWDKYSTPRPYITLKRETYVKLNSPAVFIDSEFGEWEATADGVMRGGMHPKRRQKDYTKIEITRDEFSKMYLEQNKSVDELADYFNCHKKKVVDKIKEFDLKKPMHLKQELMTRTNNERYGVDHPMQNSEVRAEIMKDRDVDKFKDTYKQTMLERYGVENGFHVKEIKDRANNTMLEKYGTVHALQAEICKEKFRKTVRDKYNDDTLIWSGYNVEEIRNKTTATNKANLGVEFPFQSEEIQEKVKQTFIKNYGTDKIAKLPFIREKMTKSLLARFGVHHLSDPEMRERIKQTSLREYGCECSLQNPEIAQKSYETRLKNDSFNKSEAEKEIRQYIKSVLPTTELKYNVRSIIYPYELDIVIPDKHIAVEYNGFYYHTEAWKDNDYHARKYRMCRDAGYRLISIFEHEWYTRQTAVKSRLKAILGGNHNIIGARRTEFSIATKDEALHFLNQFHIQGGARFEHAFKLTYDGIMVAVMTFARHHRQNSTDLVLNRFCVKDNYTIIGGTAKLLKNADINESIISFSDNRWSEGDIYQKLGFQLDALISADYFYVDKNKRVFSKQSMKKTKEEMTLGKTEHELRLEQGYLRVYDCGKIRWRLDPLS